DQAQALPEADAALLAERRRAAPPDPGADDELRPQPGRGRARARAGGADGCDAGAARGRAAPGRGARARDAGAYRAGAPLVQARAGGLETTCRTEPSFSKPARRLAGGRQSEPEAEMKA